MILGTQGSIKKDTNPNNASIFSGKSIKNRHTIRLLPQGWYFLVQTGPGNFHASLICRVISLSCFGMFLQMFHAKALVIPMNLSTPSTSAPTSTFSLRGWWDPSWISTPWGRKKKLRPPWDQHHRQRKGYRQETPNPKKESSFISCGFFFGVISLYAHFKMYGCVCVSKLCTSSTSKYISWNNSQLIDFQWNWGFDLPKVLTLE